MNMKKQESIGCLRCREYIPEYSNTAKVDPNILQKALMAARIAEGEENDDVSVK